MVAGVVLFDVAREVVALRQFDWLLARADLLHYWNITHYHRHSYLTKFPYIDLLDAPLLLNNTQ